MSDRVIPLPPDAVVLLMLISESIDMGHLEPEDSFKWAAEQGYVELVDDDSFVLLDAGREHVADQIIYPNLN